MRLTSSSLPPHPTPPFRPVVGPLIRTAPDFARSCDGRCVLVTPLPVRRITATRRTLRGQGPFFVATLIVALPRVRYSLGRSSLSASLMLAWIPVPDPAMYLAEAHRFARLRGRYARRRIEVIRQPLTGEWGPRPPSASNPGPTASPVCSPNVRPARMRPT
jgi:hypothetical protein